MGTQALLLVWASEARCTCRASLVFELQDMLLSQIQNGEYDFPEKVSCKCSLL